MKFTTPFTSSILKHALACLFLFALNDARAQYFYQSNQYHHENGFIGSVNISLSEQVPISNKPNTPPKETWNGPYRFQSEQKTTDSKWENRTYIETGNYYDGTENGEWTYIEQSTSLKIEELQASSLKYRINTLLKSHKGSWRKGVRNGDWSYEVIENPTENKRVIESLNYTFKNGWLNGPLRYTNAQQGVTVSGQLADGLMVGDWVWNYQDSLTEYRLYEKGVLISLLKQTDSDTQQWIFPLSSRCLDALKSREKTGDLVHYPMSFTFSDGYPKQSSWVRIQQNGQQALEDIHERISAFLPSWKAEMGLAFGTNRCIYPLVAEEEIQLSKWLELRNDLKDILSTINDTLALVERYPQQQELTNKLKTWLHIQENRWNYTETWRDIMETGRLVYYNREGQLFDFAKDLLHADTLHYPRGFELVQYPTKSKQFLSFLVENTTARIDTAQYWLDRLIAIQKRYELSKFMLQLSAEIQDLHDSLIRTCIVDTLPYGKFYGYLKDFRTVYLGEVFERRYQEFLNETDLQREQLLADSLHADLKGLEQLRFRTLHLEKLWRAIDTFYTEQRVDAFTFERLRVRTKKRLYEQLYFFVNEEIAQFHDKPIADRLGSTMRLRRLFQYFLYLRDSNTTNLERKLMRAKSYTERRAIWEAL